MIPFFWVRKRKAILGGSVSLVAILQFVIPFSLRFQIIILIKYIRGSWYSIVLFYIKNNFKRTPFISPRSEYITPSAP